MVERLVANEKVVGSSPIARSILSIMSDLAEKKCIPCEGGIPSFKIDEIHKYLKKVDGWDVKPDESKNYYLIKEFKFKNFLESQEFVNKVGGIAESEGHHPDIWVRASAKSALKDLTDDSYNNKEKKETFNVYADPDKHERNITLRDSIEVDTALKEKQRTSFTRRLSRYIGDMQKLKFLLTL